MKFDILSFVIGFAIGFAVGFRFFRKNPTIVSSISSTVIADVAKLKADVAALKAKL